MSSYVPSTPEQRKKMLARIGVDSLSELFSDIPEGILLKEAPDLSLSGCGFGPGREGMDEMSLISGLSGLAGENAVYKTVLRGAGAYRHFIPAAVKSVASMDKFVTAYTPYQAEISQGILQSIFEYQTSVCELTGMDASNASLYDGASAAAEAIAMCEKPGANRVLVSAGVNPAYLETLRTYCFGSGAELIEIPLRDGRTDIERLEAELAAGKGSVCAVYAQNPNYFGLLEDCAAIGGAARGAGAKFIYGFNPIAAAILKSPGEAGADIAVGEGQPLGLPLSFGGPYLGMIACKQALMRRLPGRIAGQTADSDGRRAFVLTLQAREQHIRRDKAQSNVCSNQALCALTASCYMSAMGPRGMADAAAQSAAKAHYLAGLLREIPGISLAHPGEFFHEFVTVCDFADEALAALEKEGILGGLPLGGGRLLWCATELVTKAELDLAAEIVRRCGESEKGGSGK